MTKDFYSLLFAINNCLIKIICIYPQFNLTPASIPLTAYNLTFIIAENPFLVPDLPLFHFRIAL